jgi:hypothetical protein
MHTMMTRRWFPGCVLCLTLMGVGQSFSADKLIRVTFTDKNAGRLTVDGRIVVKASDGGIMVQGRDGRLYSVTPAVEHGREDTGKEFAPFDRDETAETLLRQFGEEFRITTTKNYVICSNTSAVYSKWCGVLLQRLSAAFQRQWKNTDLELHEPEFPLIAIVFRDAKQFATYATQDEGPELASAQGYYSIRSNRMVMFDLTRDGKTSANSDREIARRLSAKPVNAATIVHEATHQIAFNSGMHTRYADNPLWLTEGMAMYFETPDLRSPKGWKTAGRVNLTRLKRFKEFAANRRSDDSLRTLLQDNDRFQSQQTVVDAYAESWALNYFLLKNYRQKYVEYLKLLQSKPRLIRDSKEQRIEDFSKSIGRSTEQLDKEFVRYTKRLRR